jgi:sterol 3beta-glucosyltransferase
VFTLADHLGIPFTPAYLMPITPTRALPGPLTPNAPAALNRASYLPVQQMLWQTSRAGDAAVRRRLGLGRPPIFGPFGALERRGIPTLYGFSAHVLPRPADWEAHHHVTGYWFLSAPDGWAPPDDLARFLEAGPPPVYIGFGSMGNRDPEATTRLALDALLRSKQRGVLASGWGGLNAADLPESVYMLKAAPHDWLFPRMAAVVHHGGAGTTAAGFRAGVPTIITPFFGDQPFWGARAAALGVGAAPIPRKRLTADQLAAAITRAVSDPTMRAKAAALGEQLRAEEGSARAAALIGALMR